MRDLKPSLVSSTLDAINQSQGASGKGRDQGGRTRHA